MKKIIFASAFMLASLGAPSVMAMTSTNTTNSSSPPAPYSGGAAVVKVLYPADGSTVTITATGAVIKQSPGHTAYREGWINTADICNINAASDLVGKLKAGSTNPYGSALASTDCNNTSSNNSTPAHVQPTITTPTANATANASASSSSSSTATIVTAGSQPTITTPTTAAPQSTTAAPQTTQPSTSGGKGVTALPNTGPEAVAPIFGASTLLGTLGHYFVSRRRR